MVHEGRSRDSGQSHSSQLANLEHAHARKLQAKSDELFALHAEFAKANERALGYAQALGEDIGDAEADHQRQAQLAVQRSKS